MVYRICQNICCSDFADLFGLLLLLLLLSLDELKLHTLRMRRHRLDALFLTQVYIGIKFCPSVLEFVGLRVPARYIKDFALFNVCSSCKNCSSARCASAANAVCRDVDVFGTRNVLLNRFL
jgi:hypothetical protein